ncbi:MAG: FAD-dependent oxidoreductase [Cyclobacteriaceae bacterium]
MINGHQTRIVKYIALFLLSILWSRCQQITAEEPYDVIVYGATPAGIMAAITAAEEGAQKVLLIEPMPVIGGMSTSGLNTAESEHMIDDVITGKARAFYVELGRRYYDSAYFQTFGNGRSLNFQEGDPAFFFESKHALELYEEMVAKAGIELILNTHLTDVQTENQQIKSIRLNDGSQVAGRYFIDCSYEGDLMAKAGVSYTFGREPVTKYNESLAGVRLIDDTLFARTVDADGKRLSFFNQYDSLPPGSGDKRVMNYNFRPIMTDVDSIKMPLYRPENYDSTQFNFLADYLEKNPDTHIWNLVGIYRRGSGKFEFNNQQKAIISLGMFGANDGYTDGDWETRQEIYQAHKDWTLGFLYFLSHDARVPETLRKETSRYGFAKDEFIENNHFPYYLYVREGRRMLAEQVHTQHDVFRDRQKPDAVMLGSHWVDSHHVQRIALSDSTFTNEGRIWEVTLLPFEISYRVMTPQKEECTNLLVPVCASFSHVGFCTYRLESTWMQAGQVAGTAITQAMKTNIPVQDISVPQLQNDLVAAGMVIEADSIRNYDDYEKYKRNEGEVKEYKRMYDYYGIELKDF